MRGPLNDNLTPGQMLISRVSLDILTPDQVTYDKNLLHNSRRGNFPREWSLLNLAFPEQIPTRSSRPTTL